MTNRKKEKLHNHSDADDEYENIQKYYNLFYSNKHIRFGLWEEGTRNLREALENTCLIVCDILGIQKNDIVFDAGCGVGGTAIHIAETYGAKVEGVALSNVQLQQARENAAVAGISELLNFTRQDFSEKTTYANHYFTKIIAIESIANISRKNECCSELYRILDTNGKIVIVDLFKTDRKFNPEDMQIYTNFINSSRWELHLITQKQLTNCLKDNGFKNVQFYDKTKQVEIVSHHSVRIAFLLFPILFLGGKLGLVAKEMITEIKTIFKQRRAFKEGLLSYGILYAEK